MAFRDWIRHLFRPAYGHWSQVRPKRWWSIKDRRSAKVAAYILNYEIEQELKKWGAEAGECIPILAVLQKIHNDRLNRYILHGAENRTSFVR